MSLAVTSADSIDASSNTDRLIDGCENDYLFIHFFSFMNIYQFRIVSRSNNDVNVETSKHRHNVWCYINGK